MKYLLDTHSFLWALFEDEKLTKKIKEIILNPDNEIYVSIVSFWEISLKYSIGKLSLRGISPEDLPEKAREFGIEVLQITRKEASTFHKLPKTGHKDPFDRMLIWQPINTGATLISKDKGIKRYESYGLSILWN